MEEMEPERRMLDTVMKGVTYQEEKMSTEENAQQQQNVGTEINVLFGGVVMDEDEWSVMELRPEFAIYDNMKKSLINEEV